MGKIIQRDRSVIPACDVPLEKFEEILKATADIDGIGAYKLGFSLGLRHGLPKIVEIARKYTDKPLIYDHQKAGTDIPATGKKFVEVMKEAGIDAIILFPQSGPATEYEWIKEAQENNLGVIVGGEMTHPRYLDRDFIERGKQKNYSEIFEKYGIGRERHGFIRKFAPDDMYEIAAKMGVTDFVVPGNKPDRIIYYRGLIEECGIIKSVFYSPGLIAQGGEIKEGAKAAGKRFHAIVGRGIYKAEDIREAAGELTSKL